MDSKQFQAIVDKKLQDPDYQAKLVAKGLEAPSGAKPGLNNGGAK